MQKPVILCDYMDTLSLADSVYNNFSLIAALNNAKHAGFDVLIVSSMSNWQLASEALKEDGLHPEIAKNRIHKIKINAETFTNVIAVIDNNHDEGYIAMVKTQNPSARLLGPHDIQELEQIVSDFKNDSAPSGLGF